MTRTNRRRAEARCRGPASRRPSREPGGGAGIQPKAKKQETQGADPPEGRADDGRSGSAGADELGRDQNGGGSVAAAAQQHGPVNLVAIENTPSCASGMIFFRTQCDDLTNARAELLKAIDEINQASQKQFASLSSRCGRTLNTPSRRSSAAGTPGWSSSRRCSTRRAALEFIEQQNGEGFTM